MKACDEREQNPLAAIPNPTLETPTHFKQAAAEIAFFGALNGLNDDPLRPHIRAHDYDLRWAGN